MFFYSLIFFLISVFLRNGVLEISTARLFSCSTKWRCNIYLVHDNFKQDQPYVKLFVVYLFMGPFILTFDPVCKIFNTEFLNVYR